MKKTLTYILCILIVGVFLLVNLREPLLGRIWDEDVSVLASVDMGENIFTIKNARDWSYTKNKVTKQEYFELNYRFEDLQGMSFYVQPLDYTGLIAHTFVIFHFDKSYGEYKDLGISVETRREQGEEYSLLGGLFNKFELTHTWATENDLVSRRAVFYDYEVFPYEVTIPKNQQIAVLQEFLKQTDRLQSDPVFYNTALKNCTNALAQYINQIAPKSIPWHYSFIFTGRSDDYLRSLGYIK